MTGVYLHRKDKDVEVEEGLGDDVETTLYALHIEDCIKGISGSTIDPQILRIILFCHCGN
jgi:hypothetical protein